MVRGVRAAQTWGRLRLSVRFALASAAILCAGALVLGSWVTREIETSVLRRVAADSALYVEALVGPHLQSLAAGALSGRDQGELGAALDRARLGARVVSAKVWSPDGAIVFATGPGLVGRRPLSRGLPAALAGSVVSERSDLGGEENVYERSLAGSLIETYIPIRLAAADRVIAVVEFYQLPDLLELELGRARSSTWLIIAVATAGMYALLAGIVRAGSDTIDAQRRALEASVAELAATAVRLREVGASRAETDEAVLRRVARELHDGLAQDLAAALLMLERGAPDSREGHARAAIESALAEVRSLARGLALPDLAPLDLTEVIEQACSDHERKTGRTVTTDLAAPIGAPALPTKIAVYRILQEALSNAFRHAPSATVRVRAFADRDRLVVECVDDGPGLPDDVVAGLGLRGMRERVELSGGALEITRPSAGGTCVRATLPMAT